MRKILFIAIYFIAFNAQAQNVGIGVDTPLQKLDVRGNQYIRDSLGIGVPSPHAQLHFANTGGRKIILYEDGNNANQYYGMAIDPSTLRFQTSNAMSFNVGTSANVSIEAIKINYQGIGIGNSDPTSPLQFANNFAKKKLVLYDTTNNAHQFYGFGATQGLLNYQSQGDHAFYAGTSPVLSKELVRISSTGNVGVGVSAPHAQIQLANSTGRKIILYEDGNNDNQYYGIAIDPSALRFQTNNNFVFYDGTSATTSNELFRISGNGFVGIGNSNPTAPLHFSNKFLYKKLALYDTSNNTNQFYGLGVTNNLLNYQSQGDHAFFTGTSPSSSKEVMRLSSTGNVGIGVANPHAPIHLANTDGRKIILFENGNNDHEYYGLGIDPSTLHFQSGSDFAFFRRVSSTSSAELLRIEGNGNVGIGINDPQQKLDVNGNIAATGSLVIGGNISATGNIIMGLENQFYDYTASGNASHSISCSCSSGKKVIGGGGGHRDFNSAQKDITVNFSGPSDDGTGWHVLVTNTSSASRVVRVWAICAKMQ